MRKLVIMCDIDGILADTLPYWLQKIGDDTGVYAKTEDITRWELSKCAPFEGKVSEERICRHFDLPNYHLDIPVMPGAVEGVKKLMDAGHDVYFVTARFGACGVVETLQWVKNHFPFVNVHKQVVFLKDKYRFQADVIIDDRAENLEDYWGAHGFASCIGIIYPYNVRLEGHPIYRMVPYGHKAWNGIVKLVRIFSDMERGDGYTKEEVEEIEAED